MNSFKVGERWRNNLRGELDIAAVEKIDTPCGGSIVVICYRYLHDGRAVYLRAASQAQGWVRVL